MKLNHILVITTDLKMMEDFWTKVIGLQLGDRPPFPFNGLWLYSEGTPFVHVAEQKDASFGGGSIAHLAFEGADYGDLLSRLKQSNYVYTERDVPLSEDRQVFIAGPDGLTVEMMFPLIEMQKQDAAKARDYHSDKNTNFLGGNLL